MPAETADPSLVATITARAAAVRERIERAARRAGRAPSDVTLVAVTKTHPVETVRAAVAAGLVHLGENRVQELLEKAAAVPGRHAGGDVCWHLIGSLQRNKARDAAAVADLVETVDSERLALALAARAEAAGRVLDVLVQVNISGEAAKSGVPPEAAHALLATVAASGALRPVGLMGIAAPAADDAEAERVVRPAFASLRRLRDAYPGPGRDVLEVLSMGMSGDLEIAVEEGATHVRVGSALFGSRPPSPTAPDRSFGA